MFFLLLVLTFINLDFFNVSVGVIDLRDSCLLSNIRTFDGTPLVLCHKKTLKLNSNISSRNHDPVTQDHLQSLL